MSRRFSGDVRLNLTDPRRINYAPGLYLLKERFISRNGRGLNYPFGFSPTLHEYRFDELAKLKAGRNIFVGSMADVFGAWVPDEWIEKVFEACDRYPQHNYLFLTKNPSRYTDLHKRGLLRENSNFWYGSTITAPTQEFFYYEKVNTFLSIEPLLEPFDPEPAATALAYINWIIVGAESGNRKDKVKPDRQWVDDIHIACKTANVPLFMKSSVKELMGDGFVQEFPVKLVRETMGTKRRQQRFSKCGFCKQEFGKGEMITLLTQPERDKSALTIGHACAECFAEVEKLVQPGRGKYFTLYSGECACCGNKAEKSEMIAILIRKKRLDSTELLCYLCEADLDKVKFRLSADKPWKVGQA